MTKKDQKVVKIDRSKLKKRGSSKKLDAADKVVDKDTGEVLKDRAAVQQSLPAEGMQTEVHPDINEAAAELSLAEEKAKSANNFRKEREAVLIQKMEAHGCTNYVNRGLNINVTLTTTKHAKVKQFDHNEDTSSADYE